MNKYWIRKVGTAMILFLFLAVSGLAQVPTDFIYNGDLEISEPWFWEKVGEGDGGAQLIWTADEAHHFHRSLKIIKGAASNDDVSWTSWNFSQFWWNSMSDLVYKIGGWYKTSGVNTNPATVDEGIAFIFEFYKDGTPLVAPQVIPIDQTMETSDWDTAFAYVVMPDTADSALCHLAMGKDATGTVWFDDIVVSSDPWSAGMHNGSMEFPDGHGGGWSQGPPYSDYEYATDFAHSGMYSAKLQKDSLGGEITWSTVPNGMIEAGKYYKISVWAKTEELNTNPDYIPSGVVGTHVRPRVALCYSFMREGWATDWPWISDQFMYLNQVDASTDWAEYVAIAMAPDEAVGITIRPRFNHDATGTAWFDDISVREVQLSGTNLIANGDLETAEPWFWDKVNEFDGGAQLTWATDEARNFHRSLEISKPLVSNAEVGWRSWDFSQFWWNRMADLVYKVGGWYKSEGVNVNPGGAGGQIGYLFKFYKDGIPLVFDQFVPIDQTVAATDWDTAFSYVVLPDTPDMAECFVKMGPQATGTIWFDDFVVSSDPWSGGVFNGSVEFPASMGGGWSQGPPYSDYEYFTSEAHSGVHSAKLHKDSLGGEITWSTVPNAGIQAGNYYKISAWVKTAGLNTDPDYIPSAVVGDHIRPRVALCYSFMRDGWATDWPWISDQFMYVNQVDDSTDWTEYVAIAMAPEDAVGITMRPRFNHDATGTAWFDDLSVEEIIHITSVPDEPFVHEADIPVQFSLEQNYPNPFNPETSIRYTLQRSGAVRLDIYNLMGQRVRTLIDEYCSAGSYKVVWDGMDDRGNRAVSGVYIYQLRANDAVATRKMILLK